MRAVVYRGVNDLRLETVPVPRIGRHELLVKVAACGVCPTDIKKIQYGTVPPPRIFGHETAGVIWKLGSGVSDLGWKIGDRVALHHHVPCLDCHFCRHQAYAQCETYKRTGITAGFEPAGGGYAEYVRVMPFVLPGVVKIPHKNTFAEGAMLEPVNTVLKAVRRLSLLPDDVVLVTGQGPIGLMFTRLLELAGARILATDLLESRLKLAKKFGAKWVLNVSSSRRDETVGAEVTRRGAGSRSRRKEAWARTSNPKSRDLDSYNPAPVGAEVTRRGSTSEFSTLIRRATRRRGLDAAVIAVPSDDAVRQAFQLVRGGGQILLFAHTKRSSLVGRVTPCAPSCGFDLYLSSICVDEKDLLGSYSSDFTLQKEVARLVFSRQLDVRDLISHTFHLEQSSAAIALAADPTADSLKIMVSASRRRGHEAWVG